MLISFILFLGYRRLAKQVWATKCLVLIYKAAVNTKKLRKKKHRTLITSNIFNLFTELTLRQFLK